MGGIDGGVLVGIYLDAAGLGHKGRRDGGRREGDLHAVGRELELRALLPDDLCFLVGIGVLCRCAAGKEEGKLKHA